jgi:hypothetical protein
MNPQLAARLSDCNLGEEQLEQLERLVSNYKARSREARESADLLEQQTTEYGHEGDRRGGI